MNRLSLNSMTADYWSLADVIDACAEHGVEWVGPWRHKLEDVEDARRRIDAAGLKVSSLCRGGFFAADNADDDNRLRGRAGGGAGHRRPRARLRAAPDPRPRGGAGDHRGRASSGCCRTRASTASGSGSSRCTR